jgi:hypothetical protein
MDIESMNGKHHKSYLMMAKNRSLAKILIKDIHYIANKANDSWTQT